MAKFERGHNKAAKLTATNVQDMRALYAAGEATQGELSRDFGVSVVQVGRILRGESWQSLPALPPSARQLDVSAHRMLALQREITSNGAGGMERLAAEAAKEQKGSNILKEIESLDTKVENPYPWLKKEST